MKNDSYVREITKKAVRDSFPVFPHSENLKREIWEIVGETNSRICFGNFLFKTHKELLLQNVKEWTQSFYPYWKICIGIQLRNHVDSELASQMWKRIVYLKLIDKFSLNYTIED